MKNRLVLKLAAPLILGVVLTGCLANLDNTGPPPEQQPCTSTHTGTLEVTQPNTVIDRLCLNNGTLVVGANADGTVIKNSVLKAAPPGDFAGVYILDGAENITVDHNEIDCQGDIAPENAASHGIDGSEGSINVTATANEIRNCSDGIVLGSNSIYARNLIHLPDNSGDLHADGVQGYGVTNVLFEWNVINFPDASSSFQFHSADGPQTFNTTVRYNQFLGGAAVLRLPGGNPACQPPNPSCGPWSGNEVYGNRIDKLTTNEFFICTGEPDSISVWGRETGSKADSLSAGDGVLDDDNVVHGTNTIIERSDCGAGVEPLALCESQLWHQGDVLGPVRLEWGVGSGGATEKYASCQATTTVGDPSMPNGGDYEYAVNTDGSLRSSYAWLP